MRPDPRRRPDVDEAGRIIYLGDVRRRRGTRRLEPDTHYLGALALVALACLGTWLVIVFSLQPSRLLTYLAFFVPLGGGIAALSTIGVYGLEWRRGLFPSLGRCLRRGLLVSGVIIANLALQAAHRWTILVPLCSVLLALGIDAIAVHHAAED